MYQEGMQVTQKECGNLDELTRRACDAERRRDDALIRLDAAEQQYKRLTMTSVSYLFILDTLHCSFW